MKKINLFIITFLAIIALAGCNSKSSQSGKIELTVLTPMEVTIKSSNNSSFQKDGNIYSLKLERIKSLQISIEPIDSDFQSQSLFIDKDDFENGLYQKNITLLPKSEEVIFDLTFTKNIDVSFSGINATWTKKSNSYRAKIAKELLTGFLIVSNENFEEFKIDLDNQDFSSGYYFKTIMLASKNKSILSYNIQDSDYYYSYTATAASLISNTQYLVVQKEKNLFIEVAKSDLVELSISSRRGIKYFKSIASTSYPPEIQLPLNQEVNVSKPVKVQILDYNISFYYNYQGKKYTPSFYYENQGNKIFINIPENSYLSYLQFDSSAYYEYRTSIVVNNSIVSNASFTKNSEPYKTNLVIKDIFTLANINYTYSNTNSDGSISNFDVSNLKLLPENKNYKLTNYYQIHNLYELEDNGNSILYATDILLNEIEVNDVLNSGYKKINFNESENGKILNVNYSNINLGYIEAYISYYYQGINKALFQTFTIWIDEINNGKYNLKLTFSQKFSLQFALKNNDIYPDNYVGISVIDYHEKEYLVSDTSNLYLNYNRQFSLYALPGAELTLRFYIWNNSTQSQNIKYLELKITKELILQETTPIDVILVDRLNK